MDATAWPVSMGAGLLLPCNQKNNLGSPGKHNDNHVVGVEASEDDYSGNPYQMQIMITAHVLCALVYAIVYSCAIQSWVTSNNKWLSVPTSGGHDASRVYMSWICECECARTPYT